MKKIRKMLPVSIYDLSGLETWLEEQAKSGLFPVLMNSWVTFTYYSLAGHPLPAGATEGGWGQTQAGAAGEMSGGGMGLCSDRWLSVLSALYHEPLRFLYML